MLSVVTSILEAAGHSMRVCEFTLRSSSRLGYLSPIRRCATPCVLIRTADVPAFAAWAGAVRLSV